MSEFSSVVITTTLSLYCILLHTMKQYADYINKNKFCSSKQISGLEPSNLRSSLRCSPLLIFRHVSST